MLHEMVRGDGGELAQGRGRLRIDQETDATQQTWDGT